MDEKQQAIIDAVAGKMDEAKKHIDEKSAESTAKYEELKKSHDELQAKFDEKLNAGNISPEDFKAMQDQLDKLNIKMQGGNKDVKTKSFNEVIKETIEANADQIKNLETGFGSKNLELKAVGDMSIAGNFPGATALYQDARTGLLINPYERQFLGDILPGGTSTGTQIVYPKENGGEGGIDEWTSGNKPQVDYDLTTETISFSWLAGIVIVDRAMLDDIAWLTSYLQNRLLLDLKAKENDFILNRAVTGLLAKATAYNGTFTNQVDRIIDAAWGQIVEDTKDMYSPTHVVMKPRAAVGIGLNKATGSGEYDLPQGSVAFSNGNLQVGGLNVLSTTSMPTGEFLAMDARATQFVKRMQPELRMFEDATLAKQNKLMFRIEERVALAVYNNQALVTGDLAGTGGV